MPYFGIANSHIFSKTQIACAIVKILNLQNTEILKIPLYEVNIV